MASDIQKDVRAWKTKTGEALTRRAATWEEAHKVLVEHDSIKASGRALLPAYAYRTLGGVGGKVPGRGKSKDGGRAQVRQVRKRLAGTCGTNALAPGVIAALPAMTERC